MGFPAGLLPISGIVVTELDAIKVLTGASAIQIGGGWGYGSEGGNNHGG